MGGKRVAGKFKKGKYTKRVPSAPLEVVGPTGEQYLGWRFEQVDFEGDWGWENLDPAHAAQLRTELVAFEKEPLRTLKDKRWVKFIPTREMRAGAEERLHEIERNDEGLWQLHLAYSKWRAGAFEIQP